MNSKEVKDIAIYGAGGFGREVACLINIINKEKPQWNLIGFYDDFWGKGHKNEYGEVIGGIDDLNSYPSDIAIAIAFGNPKRIAETVEKITNHKVYFPNIIAPDTIFLDKSNFSIGNGNIITSGCWISCNVDIGNFNVFNCFITIGHDAQIGNFNSVMPAVKISGNVSIGNHNLLGVSSVILQQIKIGDNTIIGAGSVILRKTKDGNTYIGNPAKIINY